jgi:mono/diheme cytochrome c family protein
MFLASSARAQGDAAKNYTAKCVTCHGADGSANMPAGKALKARDFHSPDVLKTVEQPADQGARGLRAPTRKEVNPDERWAA